tara:strand:- start:124 stop:780 length:657 start_codon:yes stop_codon:yes gene_type:complete
MRNRASAQSLRAVPERRNPLTSMTAILQPTVPTIILNKPFQVLCQFRDPDGRETLGTYIDTPNVYPAGRLDFDSEGLMVLTDDGKLQSKISEPRNKLLKVYWVQVEGTATQDNCAALMASVKLKDGMATAHMAKLIPEPAGLWPRDPPIRERKSIPTSWLEVSIDEGRNRQIRRMTAAIGLPALRLVRYGVGPWYLGDLQPGMTKEIPNDVAWREIKR